MLLPLGSAPTFSGNKHFLLPCPQELRTLVRGRTDTEAEQLGLHSCLHRGGPSPRPPKAAQGPRKDTQLALT